MRHCKAAHCYVVMLSRAKGFYEAVTLLTLSNRGHDFRAGINIFYGNNTQNQEGALKNVGTQLTQKVGSCHQRFGFC